MEPAQSAPASGSHVLVIDRLSQEISWLDGSRRHSSIPTTARSRGIFGLVGTIRLLAGQYLVIITKCSRAGAINGQDIWRVDETELLPFARTLLHLNEEQAAENAVQVAMIEQVLATPSLYFSYSYDLTHSLQRLHNTMPEFLQVNDKSAFTILESSINEIKLDFDESIYIYV